MLEKTNFAGLECVRLANETLSLIVTQAVGPRILTLHYQDGKNLFAEIPDAVIKTAGVGTLHLRGGHRLWHAPEVPARTYLPDDAPVTIEAVENGICVSQPVEAATGLQKELHITLPDNSATVVVDHVLRNHGLWPVTCAPWAITQMRPGGTAVLPQRTSRTDPAGLQPNRHIAIWPYTDINSPHITWGNRYILIDASIRAGALKIGLPNPAGWIGYHWQGLFFVKQAAFNPAAAYADFGASSQCYCNDSFIELETLGPLAAIEPGDSVCHRETWRVFADVELKRTEEAIAALCEHLGLGAG